VQSVASISPPDPRPTPAPDRRDAGSDSFSLMLGAVAPDGLYTIQITAQDATGQSVTVSTQYTGMVTGVDLSGSQPLLQVGSSYLTISQIRSIQKPGS
jgi:hypothetical protein